MHEGVAIDCAISAAAIDAAPYVWNVVAILIYRIAHRLGVGYMQERIAFDLTKLGIVVRRRFLQSLTSCIHLTEDVTAKNIDESGMVVVAV